MTEHSHGKSARRRSIRLAPPAFARRHTLPEGNLLLKAGNIEDAGGGAASAPELHAGLNGAEKEKGQSIDWPISLFLCGNLARPERFERPTPWFVAKYSIQLSYGRAAERKNYSTLFQHCNHFLIDGCFGGEGGIRTLDTGFSPYAPLAGECLRPLGHLSVYCVLQSARTIPVSPAPVKSARNLFQLLTAPAGPVRMRGAARARPVRGTSRRAPPTP